VNTRAPEPDDGDERGLLLGWLAFHRDALSAKCAELTAKQLVDQSAPPSSLSLLGLVRHMSEMERVYVHHTVGGHEFSTRYCSDDDPEADIEGLVPAYADASLAGLREDQATSDAILAGIGDLGRPAPGGRRTVRWNLLKLIGEYARHNGHADILRERIDGLTGE
jgi:hypothetical protein